MSRVAYGSASGVADAINKGIIPSDSIIITKKDGNEAELMFYDSDTNLKHIVSNTKFKNENSAIAYAIENSLFGNVITIFNGSKYEMYVVQPDFSLEKIGQGGSSSDSVIDVIRINGNALEIDNKSVNIPLATAIQLGIVKGSDSENGISVSEDGTMTVNEINVNKLTQDSADKMIFVCGSATE